MPANTIYLCDGCGKNLSVTDNAVEFRMVLKSELIWNAGSAVGPHIPKPLADDAYFCGWPCLENWLAKRRESNG